MLCIGSELLLGNILNSNARWLAEALAALGIPHFRQTVVGDNSQRLQEAVQEGEPPLSASSLPPVGWDPPPTTSPPRPSPVALANPWS